jgi:hypothetical protein
MSLYEVTTTPVMHTFVSPVVWCVVPRRSYARFGAKCRSLFRLWFSFASLVANLYHLSVLVDETHLSLIFGG